MKKFLFLGLILFSSTFAFAQGTQEKPLTQGEYVKLLNDLQRNPKIREEIVEMVRRRGIDFQVTDGLIGLTRTKSSSDAELARTLKEAGRRKENPTAYQPPSEKESAEVLEKARTATLAAVDEMPDFVVKQIIQRGISYAGTGNFTNLDRLVVAISYRSPDISGANGAEEYKVLSVNGVLNEGKTKYGDVGGTTNYGEFVTRLHVIFKSESETKFELIDTDVVNNRKTIVYSFSIDKDKKPSGLIFESKEGTLTGLEGKIWIDRENFRVLRFETTATDIPSDFPIQGSKSLLEYNWVTINNEKYLLPSVSENRLTYKDGRNKYETRNVSRYKEYQRFGSEVKILDDDNAEPVEEVKKP